jgi:hypothetical protein
MPVIVGAGELYHSYTAIEMIARGDTDSRPARES